MKKVNITTPENIELEVVLAEVLSRTTAAFIDLLIQGFATFWICCGFIQAIFHFYDRDSRFFTGLLIGGLVIIVFVIMYGYFIFFEIKWCGQTIGKRIMHLRVIRNNGGPVTFKEVAIRNLFRVLLDNSGIGVILMFFTKNNKRLGDMVAGTMVIVEEKQKIPVALEKMVQISDEVKSYLSHEEYNLLRDYFERKQTMTHYKKLRKEMKKYFEDKFIELGIYEANKSFIDSL